MDKAVGPSTTGDEGIILLEETAAEAKVLEAEMKLLEDKIKRGEKVGGDAKNGNLAGGGGLNTAGNRFYRNSDEFKNAIAKGENVFYVGKHTDITPRPAGPNGIAESHHGVNSVWMEAKYSNYNMNNAPTIYMLKNPNHNATRAIFPTWRAEIRAKQGGSTVDYSKVTHTEIMDLTIRQFDAADVPQVVRSEYFNRWNDYIKNLKPIK